MTNGTTNTGGNLGYESSLSTWAGPYVTDMLGRGRAVASQPYQTYTGPLSAGIGGLQEKAFTGAGEMTQPTNAGVTGYSPTAFTSDVGQTTDTGGFSALPGVAGQYMNPYLESSLQPQIDEMRREADINRLRNAAKFTQQGAYGGSRFGIEEAELDRNLLQGIAGLRGTAYRDAFDQGRSQFNTEQERAMKAQDLINQYGFDILGTQERLGDVQRGITSEGLAADRAQFTEERDYPYKQIQYMQSLLQELPLAAQANIQTAPSGIAQGISAGSGILGILGQLGLLPSGSKEKE